MTFRTSRVDFFGTMQNADEMPRMRKALAGVASIRHAARHALSTKRGDMTDMTTGARIRAAREIARLTPAELAAKVPCSERSVRGWELDATPPGSEQLRGLALALGVSADFLLGIQMPARKRGAS